MSFERDSVFGEHLSSENSAGKKKKSGGKPSREKKDEGLDDIFGEKDKSSRVPVKRW